MRPRRYAQAYAVTIALRIMDRLFKSRKSGTNRDCIRHSSHRSGRDRGLSGRPLWPNRRCLEIIAQAVADSGVSLETIVRTRIMLTDISQWETAACAHGEILSAVRPASTFVEVKDVIDAEWLVEVEADCVGES